MGLEKIAMNLTQRTAAWLKASHNTSILQTKSQKIHGVNSSVTYPRTGKSFDLPRFSSVEMQQARIMNKIAIKDEYIIRSKKALSSTKILPEDLKRLESTAIEDTYKRAFWINPKDNKAYHLLDNGRTKDGLQKLRILDENGVFVKNATVKPKTVILSDLNDAICIGVNNNYGKVDITHTDIINIVARRYNPFAKYKNVIWQDAQNSPNREYFKKIYDSIDKDTSCISASFGMDAIDKEWFRTKGKKICDVLEDWIKKDDSLLDILKLLKKISNKTRVLISAGNRGCCSINTFLVSSGAEGVGGLNSLHKVHINSGSKNSLFTQHYETFEFPIKLTGEGINITGLHGTDFAASVNSPIMSNSNIAGTSFSTPVRAAKLALNEMMDGVL